MKAVVYEKYGTADNLHLIDLPTPVPVDDQVLIRIHAVSINGSDREGLAGRPLYARMRGLRKPRRQAMILGSDIAGVVASAGRNVTEFATGDEVFGEIPGYHGGFAEYVCVDGRTMMKKPAGLTFEQAAAIPQAGCIALRGIRDQGQAKPGQRVLINGAGGSGGSFAIQLAKLAGAEVTGVDNVHKQEFMRSLGADHVIDYGQHDFTANTNDYDLILDLVAHRSVFACARALRDGGTYYFVGGSVAVAVQMLLFGGRIRKRYNRHVRMLMVPQNRADLVAITEMCEAGEVRPVIGARFSGLHEVPAAMRHVADGRATGKVVISVVA
jgi:NADPH:quinone reductase-like Zn-dependent oxidoreductase